MNPASYGVGVLGTGIMGRRMLAALQQHPRFHVAALSDPQAQALQAAAQATPGARAVPDLDTLLADPAVNLVYIATPPAAHLPAVQATLAAGRACLCEKPLAHGVAEAQALRDVVVHSGRPFAVNFPFARSAASLGLLALVHQGQLGTPQQARITVRFARWPRDWQAGASGWLAGPAEGGFTREVLSHFVFLSLRLFGPATVAGVELQRLPGQSETALRARLVHGAVTVDIDAAVAGEVVDQNRYEIVGSAGSAALSQWAQLEHDGQPVLPRADSTPLTLDSVAAMLDGRADHGLATADEALAVVRCIEAMLQP